MPSFEKTQPKRPEMNADDLGLEDAGNLDDYTLEQVLEGGFVVNADAKEVVAEAAEIHAELGARTAVNIALVDAAAGKEPKNPGASRALWEEIEGQRKAA